MNEEAAPKMIDVLKNLVLACESNGLRDLPFVRDARRIIDAPPSSMHADLAKELRDSADEEDNAVGVQQDFYHAELLRKAADALEGDSSVGSVDFSVSLSSRAKIISRIPSDDEVKDICWQINRKQKADRVDAQLVRDVWAAVVYLSRAVQGVTVSPLVEPVGWETPEEWEMETRMFHACGRSDVPKDVQELVAQMWKQYCLAAAPAEDNKHSLAETENERPVDFSRVVPDERLFDDHAPMADGETKMTAAEEVLAWLLVECVGVPDDVSYTPAQAQEIISERITRSGKVAPVDVYRVLKQYHEQGMLDGDHLSAISRKIAALGASSRLEKGLENDSSLDLEDHAASGGPMTTTILSDDAVDLARYLYKTKVEEYDRDFHRENKPEGFWAEKYGTNLHSTSLGEQWAMRHALSVVLERAMTVANCNTVSSSKPKAVAIAKMLFERTDFNLRINDLWSDAAKEMARFILADK